MKLANRVVLGAFEILSVKARGSFVYCAMGEEAQDVELHPAVHHRDALGTRAAPLVRLGDRHALDEVHAVVVGLRAQLG